MEDIMSSEIEQDQAGQRLDLFLTKVYPELTRTYIQKLIDEEQVKVNYKTSKANYKLKEGDFVEVQVPPPEALEVTAEDIPLEILYEDGDVVVVNKAQGMVVHPAHGNYSRTLVNALLFHCQDLSGINGVLRPGIVHRIDKDTSGVLMVAKNDQAHLSLAEQIKDHTVKRIYKALVHGNIQEETGLVDAPIGRDEIDRKKMAVTLKNSREAKTRYQVIERFGDYTLLEARLETGRTHQIRVHMAYLGHPVVGDPVYGPKKAPFNLNGQLLHAEVLGFNHPRTTQYMEFSAPLPLYMASIIEKLHNKIKGI